jgi:aromatic ring-opening dioxygenase catalytic subunit (LigB family)
MPLIGALAMSHGPQLLTPPEKWADLRDNPAKSPESDRFDAHLTPAAMRAHAARCEQAIADLKARLAAWQPDAIVVVGDDQNENILKDNSPPFTLYIGDGVTATLKYGYFGTDESQQVAPYKTDPALAEAILTSLMEQGFDPSWSRATRYPGGLGHAFGRALKFLTPDAAVPIVAVMVNTYHPPVPSPKRCVQFGAALGAAVRAASGGKRVLLLASGGLSHTIIDEELDAGFIDAMRARDFAHMERMPAAKLVRGSSEIRNWMVVSAASKVPAEMIDYVPCYRTRHGVGCAMGFAFWKEAA